MSEFMISFADRSKEYKNFLTSGRRLSATVLIFDLPTEIPVGKLEIKKVLLSNDQFLVRIDKPVQSCKWKQQTKLLMKFAEFFVGSE